MYIIMYECQHLLLHPHKRASQTLYNEYLSGLMDNGSVSDTTQTRNAVADRRQW